MPDTEPLDDQRTLWLELHRGPAIAINRLATNVIPTGGLRVSFAEQYDDNAPAIYRTAVIMSDWNAYELWKLLGQMQPVLALIQQQQEDEAVKARENEDGA